MKKNHETYHIITKELHHSSTHFLVISTLCHHIISTAEIKRNLRTIIKLFF